MGKVGDVYPTLILFLTSKLKVEISYSYFAILSDISSVSQDLIIYGELSVALEDIIFNKHIMIF